MCATKLVSDREKEKKHKELYEVIASLGDADDVERFFLDLCTPLELLSMADRWEVAKLLDQNVPYRTIYERIGVSTATVTRVARAMSYGPGGYRIVLGKRKRSLDEKE